jgi:hypothetical protein
MWRTAPQILWVNMVTSVALGLLICFDPREIDAMQRPPRTGPMLAVVFSQK